MKKLIYCLFIACAAIFAVECGGSPKEETANIDSAHNYSALQAKIDSLAKTLDCKVRVGLVHLETGDTFSYNGYEQSPMMSTCKFPLALLVLDKIDSGKLKLTDVIHIPKEEMREGTYSPLRDSFKGQPVDLSIHDLLYYSVAVSDNIATDVLLHQVAGPGEVTAFAKSKGLQGINMVHTEGELGLDWTRPYENWVHPMEMANLMAGFYKGRILSKTGTDTLRQIMERTTGGADRIKGMLPAGTVVAHKTGTSGFENGINIAVNDIGIVTLPNGRHLVLTIYIGDAAAETPACEKLIAQIARAAYDDALTR